MITSDLSLCGPHFVLLLIHVVDTGQNTQNILESTMLIHALISEIFAEEASCFRSGSNEIVTIISTEKEAQALVRHSLDRLSQMIATFNFQGSIAVAVSQEYEELSLTSSYYEQIRLLIRFGNAQRYSDSVTVYYYIDAPDNHEFYHLTKRDENRIGAYISEGNTELVRQLLTEIINENIVSKKLDYIVKRLFISELVACLMKALNNENIDPLLLADGVSSVYSQNTTIHENINMIHLLYQRACELVNAARASRVEPIIQNIQEYIHKNYHNPMLNVGQIADNFKYSESYISSIFRAETGVQLYSYLESVRMEHAQQLLSGTNHSVSIIAEQAGYLNYNTFCRAFKRIYGMTASTYRRQNQE